jgi:long-subunit acyl-CoA synthetase (AMP-forming)
LELHQSGKLKQFLFRRAYQAKLRWLREGRVVNNSIWDRLVFDSIRARFGGRVHTIACGAGKKTVIFNA